MTPVRRSFGRVGFPVGGLFMGGGGTWDPSRDDAGLRLLPQPAGFVGMPPVPAVGKVTPGSYKSHPRPLYFWTSIGRGREPWISDRGCQGAEGGRPGAGGSGPGALGPSWGREVS